MGAARKLDYDYDCQEKRQALNKTHKKLDKRRKKRRMASIKAQRKKRRRFVLRGTLGIIAFILMFNLQVKQEKIVALNLESEKLDAIINESKDELLALNSKAENKKSNIDIVYEAQTKLGMTFPKDDQKVYFTVDAKEARNEDNREINKAYKIYTGKKD